MFLLDLVEAFIVNILMAMIVWWMVRHTFFIVCFTSEYMNLMKRSEPEPSLSVKKRMNYL